MMKLNLHAVAFAVLTTLGLAAVTPAIAADPQTRLHARLSGPKINRTDRDTPSGSSDFRIRRGQTQFSVEVEDVMLPAGTTLQVFIDGSMVGSMQVNALHIAEIDENTNDGGTPPAGVSAGDVIVVKKAGGKAIASGVFSAK